MKNKGLQPLVLRIGRLKAEGKERAFHNHNFVIPVKTGIQYYW